VCSSGFVQDPWLSTLEGLVMLWDPIDWRSRVFSYFQLLSDLCQLANKTTDDAIDRLLLQSFVASNVITKDDFERQLNVTLNQFYQSTTTYFDLLVETVHLLIQVDQPYMELLRLGFHEVLDPNIILNIITNETNNHQSLQVCLYR
jgi:hypothetical protein